MIEQASFVYSSLTKAFLKKTKKQTDALKSLNISNKIDELKQIESISLQNRLNNLIIDKLKEINKLQSNIKLRDLEYTIKREKKYGFSKYSLPIVF